GRSEQRLQPLRELVRREPHDVLLVEPLELLGIENRIAAADTVERKQLDQLVLTEQLAVARSGRPPEQPEKVHHRFREKSLTCVFHDGRRAVTLAEALLVRTENQRHMCELRNRRTK